VTANILLDPMGAGCGLNDLTMIYACETSRNIAAYAARPGNARFYEIH
jgi:hypothetical protein